MLISADGYSVTECSIAINTAAASLPGAKLERCKMKAEASALREARLSTSALCVPGRETYIAPTIVRVIISVRNTMENETLILRITDVQGRFRERSQ